MAANDYAILVGISRYADPALHKLDGPLNDIRLMQQWLQSPDGGDLPPGNVTAIVSDESALDAPSPGELPPLVMDFIQAFMGLVDTPNHSGYVSRPGARLYLYFSGHGFSEKGDRAPHAALYAANANANIAWNIYGTFYAQWAKDWGLFGEIVLIMDCCRDASLVKDPTRPPLRKATDTALGNAARLLEIYAAPRGGKAQERRIPARGGEVHGLLTHAFIEAVQHAAPQEAAVSSVDLKRYFEENWALLCGDEPADTPEVVVPSRGDIRFQRARAQPVAQCFRISALGQNGGFTIHDGALNAILSIRFAGKSAEVHGGNGAARSIPIVDGALTVGLPAGFYAAVAKVQGDTVEKQFQAGGPDVVF